MTAVNTIRTDEDLDAALARIEEIFDAEPGTPEDAELGRLIDLVEAYEGVRYSMPPPTALEMIEFRMDQQGLSAEDLIPCIGSLKAVEEVLAGKREITPSMARRLEELLQTRLSDLLDGGEDGQSVKASLGVAAFLTPQNFRRSR